LLDVARRLKQLTPIEVEDFYNRLTGYGFARRYVEGKTVVNLCWGNPGYGARILAETARSVAALVNSPEALELASTIYSAPNVTYREAASQSCRIPQIIST
jgi:hypothetical protein